MVNDAIMSRTSGAEGYTWFYGVYSNWLFWSGYQTIIHFGSVRTTSIWIYGIILTLHFSPQELVEVVIEKTNGNSVKWVAKLFSIERIEKQSYFHFHFKVLNYQNKAKSAGANTVSRNSSNRLFLLPFLHEILFSPQLSSFCFQLLLKMRQLQRRHSRPLIRERER